MLNTVFGGIMVLLDVFWFLVVLFNILAWITQKGDGYIPFPKEWSFVFLFHVFITLFIML